MINVKKAKDLANAEFPELSISSCLDIGESFAFTFVNEDNMPVPGVPVVTVTKNDGHIDYLTIPPIENLMVLEKATKVEI